MSSAKHLNDFAQHWRYEPGFTMLSTGNCNFSARVIYEYAGGDPMSDVTSCLLVRNGFEDGKVSLEETDELTLSGFHLDFTHGPGRQTYNFDRSTNALVIVGSSIKMGGNYKVTILPQ